MGGSATASASAARHRRGPERPPRCRRARACRLASGGAGGHDRTPVLRAARPARPPGARVVLDARALALAETRPTSGPAGTRDGGHTGEPGPRRRTGCGDPSSLHLPVVGLDDGRHVALASPRHLPSTARRHADDADARAAAGLSCGLGRVPTIMLEKSSPPTCVTWSRSSRSARCSRAPAGLGASAGARRFDDVDVLADAEHETLALDLAVTLAAAEPAVAADVASGAGCAIAAEQRVATCSVERWAADLAMDSVRGRR